MAEGKTVFECEGCGESYDILLRDVDGDFHFLAMEVGAEADGTLTVVGHWHSGVFDEAQSVQLTRRDGHIVAIASIAMQPPLSEASHRQGQRVLTVRTSQAESFHPGGCIRPVHR